MPTLKQSNPLNNVQKTYGNKRSEFNLGYPNGITPSYADATPFFVMESVEGDDLALGSAHEIRTDAQQSPVMTKTRVRKDYFEVPLRAIYPRTMEDLYAQPTQGEDSPSNLASYLCLRTLYTFLGRLYENMRTEAPEGTPLNASELSITARLRYAFMLERFLSTKSIFSLVHYPLHSLFSYEEDGVTKFFDNYFDEHIVPLIRDNRITIFVPQQFDNEVGVYYSLDKRAGNYVTGTKFYHVSLSRMIDILRNSPVFHVVGVNPNDEDVSTIADLAMPSLPNVANFSDLPWYNDLIDGVDAINLERVLAYQLIMNHYQVDPKVDFLHTADKWREYIETLMNIASSTSNVLGDPNNDDPSQNFSSTANTFPRYYRMNGINKMYDTFSSCHIEMMMCCVRGVDGSGNTAMLETSSYVNYPLAATTYVQYTVDQYGRFGMDMGSGANRRAQAYSTFMYELFALKSSLRYGDYFTGAHPTQNAVGNVNTPVVGDAVNTIDLTRNLNTQRFLNTVNRGWHTLEDYIKNIFGTDIKPRTDVPRFIGSMSQILGTQEVENTADAQGRITSFIRTSDGSQGLNVRITEPGIIMGIMTFEAQRVYSLGIDRFAFKRQRYDRYNPFFQYDVDQAILGPELYGPLCLQNLPIFAYTLRYMEYKQKVGRVSGAFVNGLPGYMFVTDNPESGLVIDPKKPDNINPMYLRSQNSEYDRFFEQPSGYSLGNYYHFQVKIENFCNASRPMEYAPQVL